MENPHCGNGKELFEYVLCVVLTMRGYGGGCVVFGSGNGGWVSVSEESGKRLVG